MSLRCALDKVSIGKNRLPLHRGAFRSIWWSAFAILICCSCNSKKYLSDNQSFLFANKTSLKSKEKIANKSGLYENLISLYRQPETKTVFGVPRHVFYYQYIERRQRNPNAKEWSDERLIKNKPVIYDSLKAAQTTEDFRRYLSLRGYRYASTSFKVKTQDKETIVYYKVDPGIRLYIDSFIIVADDPHIQLLIDSLPNPHLIGNGSPLDIELFNLEKSRIIHLVQNEGYATLDESYIPQLLVDTSKNQVKAIMRVLNPTDSTAHLKYNVGNITVYPHYDATLSKTFYDTLVNFVNYKLPDSAYFSLKPEAIERNIYLYPGRLTRIDNYDKTLKGLQRIDLIKFVTPTLNVDTSDITVPKINYAFYLTRNKKIDFGVNTELTYSNLSTSNKTLFGISVNTDYRDLNTFHGAEVLNINLEAGFEFNFEKPAPGVKRDIFNSVNLGVGTNITFPRFMDPLRLYHLIGYSRKEERKPLFGKTIAKWLTEDASTRMSLGYSFVDIQDLYQYYTVTANLSYVMQPSTDKKLIIDRIGIDLFVPHAKPKYDTILDKSRFFREGFGKKLFTGFLFRDYLYEFNTKSVNHAGYFKIQHGAEISGLEMLVINDLENAFTGVVKPFEITTGKGEDPDPLVFAHYLKGELDIRYFLSMGRKNEFAVRINGGAATPFGPFTKQVPYIKQFVVGGALSNRAWQIRELGPGGYEDPNAPEPNSTLPYYQTGDLKIDLSMEMRFKLPWYFQGVVFIDAANVWTKKFDGQRPGANFAIWRFYKEFGVGYGYGLRLDFDFFILRVDVGYKLFSPYEIVNADGVSSHFLTDEVKKFPFHGGEIQIAVGQKF